MLVTECTRTLELHSHNERMTGAAQARAGPDFVDLLKCESDSIYVGAY